MNSPWVLDVAFFFTLPFVLFSFLSWNLFPFQIKCCKSRTEKRSLRVGGEFVDWCWSQLGWKVFYYYYCRSDIPNTKGYDNRRKKRESPVLDLCWFCWTLILSFNNFTQFEVVSFLVLVRCWLFVDISHTQFFKKSFYTLFNSSSIPKNINHFCYFQKECVEK